MSDVGCRALRTRCSFPYLVILSFCHFVIPQAVQAAPPAFEELSANYAYDQSAPLDPDLKVIQETDLYTLYHLTYSSTNGDRVPSLYAVPKGEGPFPCVIILHGYGGSKADALMAIPFVIGAKIAVFAIDAQYHGERKQAGRDLYDLRDIATSRGGMIQTVVDLRRGVDFLVGRPEIDASRLGVLGASMGAILGTLFVGVEPRIHCAVLMVGGADWGIMFSQSQLPAAQQAREAAAQLGISVDDVRAALAPVDPLYFVGHISPRPVLFQLGRQDQIVPVAAGKLLVETAGEPKEVDWYDAGHALPPDRVLPRVSLWLREKLMTNDQ